MVTYINPANHGHGYQIGYTSGAISSHRLTIGKTLKIKKNSFSETIRSRDFMFLCVAMLSNPLSKSFQPCPCGPNWPRLREHHYLPKAYDMKNMEKSSFLKPQGLSPVYLVCSNA